MSKSDPKEHLPRLPSIDALLESVNLPSMNVGLKSESASDEHERYRPFEGLTFTSAGPSVDSTTVSYEHDLVTSPCEGIGRRYHELIDNLPTQNGPHGYCGSSYQVPHAEIVDDNNHSTHVFPHSNYAKNNLWLSTNQTTKSQQNTPSSPVQKGWFNPVSEYSANILGHVRGWCRDRLYEEYFFRDPYRQTYGTQPVKRPTKMKSATNDSIEVTMVSQYGRMKHSEVERGRRDRHRDRQRESHARCCEVAMALSEENMEKYKQTKCQSSRGPGKDDQLLSTIYMFDYGAIALQSEHEGRKSAEASCNWLADENGRLRNEVEQKSKLIKAFYEQTRQCFDLHEALGTHPPNLDLGYRGSFSQAKVGDCFTLRPKTPSFGDYRDENGVTDRAKNFDAECDQTRKSSRKRRRRTIGCETPFRAKREQTRGLPPSPSPSFDGCSVDTV